MGWNGKIAAPETKHTDLLTLIALYKEKLCDPNPCANGGSCKEGVCTCTTEFEGHHCKTPKEKKESPKEEFVQMSLEECPSGQAVLEKDCATACAGLGGTFIRAGSVPWDPKGCIIIKPNHRDSSIHGYCFSTDLQQEKRSLTLTLSAPQVELSLILKLEWNEELEYEKMNTKFETLYCIRLNTKIGQSFLDCSTVVG